MKTKFKAMHLFCGIGGGSLGFKNSQQEYKGAIGEFENILGIDADPEIIEDYEKITGSPGAAVDLFSREQYIDFHGQEPPEDWRELQPADLLDLTKGQFPDVVFTSPPCKGFSGLLPEKSAKTSKYQALNKLTVRGIRLCLEAFEDDLPSLFLLENVPRITSRGKFLLDEIKGLLGAHGYVFSDESHDCGEIGGLAQHRKRYLLIARNEKKMSSFVYKPPIKQMKTIGDVIGPLPLPGAGEFGEIHKVPKLQFKTWVRLALIPAGGDWRDLDHIDYTKYCLKSEHGLNDIPDPGLKFKESASSTFYRVTKWNETSNTITGAYRPNNGAISIPDPRFGCTMRAGTFGVMRWDEAAKTIIGSGDVHAGAVAINDPRIPESTEKGVFVIIAEDGTWHRPLTTFELAMLQGFPAHLEDGSAFHLSGKSDQKWRERIGNAVPPEAAEGMADSILLALMVSSENGWELGFTDIWVLPEEKEEVELVH